MADVIDLKVFRKQKEEQKFDEIVDRMEQEEKELAMLTMDSVFALLDSLDEDGIHIGDSPRAIADIYLIVEATAGLICRVKNVTHGMHKAADSFMEEDCPANPFETTEQHSKLMHLFLTGNDTEDT